MAQSVVQIMNQGKDPWALFEQLYHTVEQLRSAQQVARKEKKGTK